MFLGQDNGGGTQNKWFVDYGYFTSGSFDFHENGSTYGFLSSDAASPASATWNNLAVVKDGSLYSFYLNGSGIGSQTLSGTFPQPTAPFTIGYAEPGLGYNGLIDDVALYNRALSASEVQELAATPEPSTLALSSLVAASLFACRRKLSK